MLAKTSIVWIIGSLLVLAACGGSDEEGPSETQQPTSGNGSGEVGREEFGMTEEQLVIAIEDTEASIATCMDAAGFEYVPIDPVTFREAMSSLAAVPGLSDEEFVAQYGYGFSTLPPVQSFGAGEENARIFEDLPDEDKVAYYRASTKRHTANSEFDITGLTALPKVTILYSYIDPDAALFGDGLGLDSIDILEIALAVSKKYGFQLRSDDSDNIRIFSSLRNLSEHVQRHRTS